MDEIKIIDLQMAKSLLPHRPEDSNKGTFGKVLTIAGSLNYQGAAYLAAVSSLKTGAGLVSLAAIETVINNISALTPNLTFFHLRDSYNKCIASDSFAQLKPIIEDYNVITIGPGLSTDAAVLAFVNEALKYLGGMQIPVVIDADALNAMALSNIKTLPPNSIITPHPKELSRLLNSSVDEIQNDRISAAKTASDKFGCTTVLKGHETIICTKEFKIYKNTSGNSALAKAGSGDVLAGIISGFISQGVAPESAAVLGVYLHGICGECASKQLTRYCVLAQDIVDSIPDAFKMLLE